MFSLVSEVGDVRDLILDLKNKLKETKNFGRKIEIGDMERKTEFALFSDQVIEMEKNWEYDNDRRGSQ